MYPMDWPIHYISWSVKVVDVTLSVASLVLMMLLLLTLSVCIVYHLSDKKILNLWRLSHQPREFLLEPGSIEEKLSQFRDNFGRPVRCQMGFDGSSYWFEAIVPFSPTDEADNIYHINQTLNSRREVG